MYQFYQTLLHAFCIVHIFLTQRHIGFVFGVFIPCSVSDVNLTDGAENSKYDHGNEIKTMVNMKARTTSESLLLLPRQGRVKVLFLLTQISKV